MINEKRHFCQVHLLLMLAIVRCEIGLRRAALYRIVTFGQAFARRAKMLPKLLQIAQKDVV